MLKLGIIINPYAGIGGSVALKGSDGIATRSLALARGAPLRAAERMARALASLVADAEPAALKLVGFAGAMGGDTARALGLPFESVGAPLAALSDDADTQRAAQLIVAAGVDVIVFAGGDGTARNIADAIGLTVPVVGVPAGVKIHSGVYANTPEAAGQILRRLAQQQWAPLVEREVRDIDEQAFRAGFVRAKHYSELLVPEEPQWLQEVKNAGAVVDELMQLEVAASVIEKLDENTLYLVGPGSTTQVLLEQLGLTGTLLGVDLLRAGELINRDVSADDIRHVMGEHDGPASIIVTAIGGQGHIFGRGNQQLAADIIRRVGREGIMVIATTEKLQALNGRALQLDTNDPQLDRQLAGFFPVITGYQQQLLYPVGTVSGNEITF
ncbi:ATP-NAD kinase family protein [Gilvimarinus polysaccharolyticus]|uniref:ATP-NAD kinase family protein n=1 Tax=Gilvimarinus polysaccharolyticus TaxID=863921 RepID=UPI000673B2BA|nr:NAD(+)/NADH kinase [Gilvimarinus polysaccharolyticus]